MEVQIGPRGPVTHPVVPATDKRPPPINHGSNYQQNVNPGMFYSSDRSGDNFMGNLGSIGEVQVCESPASQPSMFDSVSAHIPLKIKEKVWAGEYIDTSLMLKSGKDLVYDSLLNGELAVKGGQLTVLQQKHNQIKNIHTWTSAFINFMSIMLEKWPGKAQVYLKYMHVIRLAASRVSNLGWFSTKMSKIFFLSMCDVKVFLTFGADLTTVLPVLFKYCCKYCYSDSQKL